MVRSAEHPLATGRYELMKPVARRPSITSSTSLWASGYMGWPRDATGGLPQDQKASRAPQAGSCRALCSRSTAVIPTASTVAEGGIGSMLDAYFGCALRAVVPCARAVHEVSGRCAHLRKMSRPKHVWLMAVAP